MPAAALIGGAVYGVSTLFGDGAAGVVVIALLAMAGGVRDLHQAQPRPGAGGGLRTP